MRIITREQIEESGANRVVDVLNRLPEVSFSVSQSSFQAVDGVASVALRGLPLGSTLVLINGRRVQGVTGAQIQSTAIFNLNYIPLSAVDRIEVSPTGSSAIYGGDALAGVVNIIFKKEFSGLEGSARYGWASGTDRTDATLAYGWQTERASVTAILSFSNQSALNGGERLLTASDDKRPFGGADLRSTLSNPANIYSLNGQNLPGLNSTFAGVPPGSSGIGLTPSDFAATAGVLNRQSRFNLLDIFPERQQYGLYLATSYQMTPSIEVFGSSRRTGAAWAAPNQPHGAVFAVLAAGCEGRTIMSERAVVFVVDDDSSMRRSLETLLRSVGHDVRLFSAAQEFMKATRPDAPGCLLLDVRLPGMSGLTFQQELANAGVGLPVIFITGYGDVPMTVRAMKAGAAEFLTKPFDDQVLLDAVHAAIERDRARRRDAASLAVLNARYHELTERERQVMKLVVAGQVNKQIAAELGLSVVTVKVHRGQVMHKMLARSVAELVRMADRLGVPGAA